MSQPTERPAASPLDAIIPTNPLAAIGCYAGIFSLLLCVPFGPFLGPVGIVLGIVGLKKWKMQESSYGATTSKIRAWIGIVTGAIGTVVGIIAFIAIIAGALRK